jgi:hypothetical protein
MTPPARQEAAEPRLLSAGRSARRLGLSRRQLGRLAEEHPLYAPAVRGVPGAEGPVGTRTRAYHRRQLELIEAVLVGAMDLEEAHLRWQVEQADIGKGGVGP